MKINDFLQELGIAGHAGLRFDPKLEGYSNFTFGCRAGPVQANVHDLAHELAHAAQFGPRYFSHRATSFGFVFKLRKVELFGRHYVEPKTAQATMRELDTFAYQAHLMQLGGELLDLDSFFADAAEVLTRFMPDWWAVPGDNTEDRRSWCIAQAKLYYARRRPETVRKRLIGWLDRTADLLAAPMSC